ncbi:glycoside hydrolase family 30 protein [Paenibacillus sp. FSL W8-0186]|uniref:Glycosyl hydrolase n=1 Tax=Paenibacillus woosongensis TaxID=307580 RepID=A0ABQ4MUS9_9BACL|nr:glycoside hydrolase family 30 protein [Paenibacillus woosongensis]GIP59694.1 glycosyl hydrolase [Paenibacillus woosongensis]
MNKTWISTTQQEYWQEQVLPLAGASAFNISPNAGNEAGSTHLPASLQVTEEQYQTVDGFGGCFNELGYFALQHISDEERKEVMKKLFDPDGECRFSICRLPMGASDYAAEWYSLNETDGDYAMEHFSIERDKQVLIPYIKEALRWNPNLTLFASPWSPPTWMKHPKAYNYGTLRWEPDVLQAYALYFVKFVQAYAEEGITIHQVYVQNEPVADQKFPSCVWTGEQLRDFIRDYLGPAFREHGLTTEIWLGTINGPDPYRQENTDYDVYANVVLSDPEARQYISGVGYQWAGKYALQRTVESYPELRYMQTENECGDGKNSWEYAHYVFNLYKHYYTNGVNSYIYWNMVLEPGGRSTWGWTQNAMITADPDTKRVVYNPEYYVMRHFSYFIQPGAVRLGIRGTSAGNALAFQNPDGGRIVIVANPFKEPRTLSLQVGSESISCELPALSFHTFNI